MEENKKLLYEFLTLNGCFFSYIEQLRSLEMTVKMFKPLQYMCYFPWEYMKEGGEYWMQMHHKWVAFYKYRNGIK